MEEFTLKMKEIAEQLKVDEEMMHVYADNLMCEELKRLGYSEAVEIFIQMDKWYA